MTPEELANLETEVSAAVDTAGNLVGAIDPELIPFIVIGKVVAKGIPEIVDVVQKWIEGVEPTAEEKTELARKMAVLRDPNLP